MKNISNILNNPDLVKAGYRARENGSFEDEQNVQTDKQDSVLDVEALQKVLFKRKKTQEFSAEGEDLAQILR